MRNNKGKRAAKSVLAAALSLSMSLSGLALPAATVLADEAVEPIKTLNFNKGFAEFLYDEEANTGDPNFEVVKARDSQGNDLYYVKTGDEVKNSKTGEIDDTTDANGLVYTGNGSGAAYKRTNFSNQPSTSTDDVKGTALTLDKTITTPEIVKTLSAGDTSADSKSSTTVAEDVAAALDKEIPVSTVVREAMTSKSQVYFSNPFYGKTASAYTLTYWEYIPKGTTTDAGLIAFESGDAVISLYYDAACKTVTAGTWTQVAVVFDESGVKFYVNGAEVEEKDMKTEGGAYALSTITGAERILFGASDKSVLETVYNTKLDDVTFYTAALSAEQIKSDYDAAYAKLNPTVDVDSQLATYTLDDTSDFTDIGTNSVSIEKTTIAGKTVKAAHVAANSSLSTMVGLSVGNPFAGMGGELEGITIGYWYKQDPHLNNKGKVDDEMPNYKSLMIVDTLKYINDPKTPSKSGDGRSWITVDNDLSAGYTEGSTYEGNSSNGLINIKALRNNYTFSISEDDQTALEKIETDNWFYVTLVATNAGIQMYVNGVKYENAATDKYGTRFGDGYYSAEAEQSDISTAYGVYGGTNNQGATQLLTFVSYEDTQLYFGWSASNISSKVGNDKSSGSWVYGVSCYNGAMSDAEVAKLYEKAQDIESTESDVKYGDADQDGDIDAMDALEILKHVVGLTKLEGDNATAANVDGKNGIDAQDALYVLKYVVDLIKKFPIEE